MTDDKRSTGRLISTLCFLGVGLWLLGEAMAADPLRAVLLGLASLACLAGAARNPIARFFEREP